MTHKILISLDYELFFGNHTGSVKACMIEPTNAILDVVQKHGLKLSLFVDAGFIERLVKESLKHPELRSDIDAINYQLQALKADGHDVQLHIHPHWVDSYFNGRTWEVDTTRYKLHDFDKTEIKDIVHRYKKILVDIVGDSVFAYRAGGWCIQPFETISEALLTEGVWLDSTVYAGGISEDAKRWFDFRVAPRKAHWRFSIDPNQEQEDGDFVELPISSIKVSPFLFWKMVITKKLTKGQHQSFGDGEAMKSNWQYYFNRLTSSTYSVASIDGLKAGILSSAWSHHKKQQYSNIFNVMGHPKAITPYSLRHFDEFLSGTNDLEPITFQDLRHLKPSI